VISETGNRFAAMGVTGRIVCLLSVVRGRCHARHDETENRGQTPFLLKIGDRPPFILETVADTRFTVITENHH